MWWIFVYFSILSKVSILRHCYWHAFGNPSNNDNLNLKNSLHFFLDILLDAIPYTIVELFVFYRHLSTKTTTSKISLQHPPDELDSLHYHFVMIIWWRWVSWYLAHPRGIVRWRGALLSTFHWKNWSTSKPWYMGSNVGTNKEDQILDSPFPWLKGRRDLAIP